MDRQIFLVIVIVLLVALGIYAVGSYCGSLTPVAPNNGTFAMACVFPPFLWSLFGQRNVYQFNLYICAGIPLLFFLWGLFRLWTKKD